LDVVEVGVVLVLLVALSLFLVKTPLGVQMRAAAENFRMARVLGVRANVVIAAAFAISGILFGIVTVALQAYLPLELRYYRDAFAYGAVIAILLVRPQGLIVARSA